MLVVLIIVLWWLVISRLIYIIIRHKKISLSFGQVVVFFGCRIAAGSLYGYIFKRYYNGDDTWKLQHDGGVQYNRLLQSPWLFVKEFAGSDPYPYDQPFYFKPLGHLEKLEYGFITKTIALFDIVSRGNYYVNVVFFNFLAFFGCYFLYKLIAAQQEPRNQAITATVIFLFPPALFWLSGIRAEGMLMLFTGTLLYQFNQWLKNGRTYHALLFGAAFAMDFILRDSFAVLLVPALLAWWLSSRLQAAPQKTFPLLYLGATAITAGSSFFLPATLNPLAAIASRQQEFFSLLGNTRFQLGRLNDRPLSFLKVLPESLLNTFLRPFPGEAKGLLQWFTVLENISVLALLLLVLFTCKTQYRPLFRQPLIWLLLLSGLFSYILIGLVVPFPGAIVRYKIIPELFIIGACLLCLPQKTTPVGPHQPTTASLQT